MQRAQEVDGGHGGHARAEHNAERVEADAARRREQRLVGRVLGKEDLDRAILVHGHDVVRRNPVDVARVHLGKVPGPNWNAVCVSKATVRFREDVNVVVAIVRLGWRIPCRGFRIRQGIQSATKKIAWLRVHDVLNRIAIVCVFALALAVLGRLVAEFSQFRFWASDVHAMAGIVRPLPCTSVQAVADDDVRVVVVVKVAHRGHAGSVHCRAHDGRLPIARGHRGGGHVALLHPQTACLLLAAVHDAALVVSRRHPAVGASLKARPRHVGFAEEAARVCGRMQRVGRDVKGAAPSKRRTGHAALVNSVQPDAVAKVAARLACTFLTLIFARKLARPVDRAL